MHLEQLVCDKTGGGAGVAINNLSGRPARRAASAHREFLIESFVMYVNANVIWQSKSSLELAERCDNQTWRVAAEAPRLGAKVHGI